MKPFRISAFFLSSLIACTTATVPPALRDTRAYCWPEGDLMRPLIFKECLDVINKDIVPPGIDPNLPIKFSQDLKLHPDFLLPKQWSRRTGNCGVYISFMESVSGYDVTTLNDIRNAAKAIATTCVIKPPHLGGVLDPLGWHSKMAVMVGSWGFLVTAAAVPALRARIAVCWDDPTKFRPLIFKDCIEVINNEITKGYDPNIPLKFSSDPELHPDVELPKYWKRPNARCGVGVDFGPVLTGYDRTTLNDIKEAALSVAIECIIKPPHVGGYMQLGWEDKLGVLIAGRRPPNQANITLSEE
ncbi:MAG: hypothetical protein Q9222_000469 [Ikaeria aurantiellina]